MGLAYTFDVVPVGGDILTPTTAIVAYVGKVDVKLRDILSRS